MARALKPDALIVDRKLPGLDGLGVIARLRKDQIQAPVLVLSGLDAVEDRVRGPVSYTHLTLPTILLV